MNVVFSSIMSLPWSLLSAAPVNRYFAKRNPVTNQMKVYKANRACAETYKKWGLPVRIGSLEEIGKCDNSSRIYLTDNYIVTNTEVVKEQKSLSAQCFNMQNIDQPGMGFTARRGSHCHPVGVSNDYFPTDVSPSTPWRNTVTEELPRHLPYGVETAPVGTTTPWTATKSGAELEKAGGVVWSAANGHGAVGDCNSRQVLSSQPIASFEPRWIGPATDSNPETFGPDDSDAAMALISMKQNAVLHPLLPPTKVVRSLAGERTTGLGPNQPRFAQEAIKIRGDFNNAEESNGNEDECGLQKPDSFRRGVLPSYSNDCKYTTHHWCYHYPEISRTAGSHEALDRTVQPTPTRRNPTASYCHAVSCRTGAGVPFDANGYRADVGPLQYTPNLLSANEWDFSTATYDRRNVANGSTPVSRDPPNPRWTVDNAVDDGVQWQQRPPPSRYDLPLPVAVAGPNGDLTPMKRPTLIGEQAAICSPSPPCSYRTEKGASYGGAVDSIQPDRQGYVYEKACSPPVNRRDRLNSQTKSQHPPRFACKLCSKDFSQSANLTAHMRTHNGEKPFTCPVCDQSFSQRSSVKIHVRIHTGERPYHCTFCPKTFSDRSTLSNHQRTHTGEKPYRCRVCFRGFSQSGNRNRHMIIHNNCKHDYAHV